MVKRSDDINTYIHRGYGMTRQDVSVVDVVPRLGDVGCDEYP
jgi:hypothetical protein